MYNQPPSTPSPVVTTPHADEVLTLADGRHLAWAEWGDPRGSPLVFLHPCPGSRLLCPDPAATEEAGVRLITVDRPGYGRSDPVAEPTLTSFAHDLERLLDHLWLGQVRVVGWSSGGQYAAACAAVLADRVSGVALVATPAPDSEVHWLTGPFREVAELVNADSDQALAAAAALGASFAAAPEQLGDAWVSPFDVATRVQPEVGRSLSTMWKEAFRGGAEGLAADVVAGSRPWGFIVARVHAPATLVYGADDSVIGPAHGRWWARTLPRAELNIRPASGHLVPFLAWSDILQAVSGSRPT
jgi:pimeloyl-ACP methyl ester carboxylesterase